MELFLVLIFSGLGLGVFYLLFGVVANKNNQRLAQAKERLGGLKVNRKAGQEFTTTMSQASSKFMGIFVITLIGSVIAGVIIAQIIMEAEVGESGNLVMWLLLAAVPYSVALIGGICIVYYVLNALVRSYAANKYIDQLATSYPKSSAIKEVKALIKPRVGELGVSSLAAAGVIGSIIVGAGIIAIFFIGTQAAIECARSSKCL